MTLDPETLLQAYSQGAFPMTDRDGQTRWYTADPRGIRPLEKFHIPHTLRQVVRQGGFEIRINYDFPGTTRASMNVRRFGCVDIPAPEYIARLNRALKRRCEFD